MRVGVDANMDVFCRIMSKQRMFPLTIESFDVAQLYEMVGYMRDSNKVVFNGSFDCKGRTMETNTSFRGVTTSVSSMLAMFPTKESK